MKNIYTYKASTKKVIVIFQNSHKYNELIHKIKEVKKDKIFYVSMKCSRKCVFQTLLLHNN